MLTAIIILTSIGLVAAVGLGVASRVFAVQVDPLVEQVAALVPGVNCGACGNASCNQLAELLVAGKAGIDACPVMSDATRNQIAALLGVEFKQTAKPVAVLFCQGSNAHIKAKYEYDGVPTCAAANMIAGGWAGCSFGCLGFADCQQACPFGAIAMVDGLPAVNEAKCTACGKCVKACPRGLFKLMPSDKRVHVRCSSHDKGKFVRLGCDIGCIACGKCVKTCPVEAIALVNDLAVIDETKCIGCGKCATVCPTKSIVDQAGPHYTARINANCTGCTLCSRKCPVGAIGGEKKQLHSVDAAKCVQCHLCHDSCNFEAIELVDESGTIMIPPKPRKAKKPAAAQQQEAAQ